MRWHMHKRAGRRPFRPWLERIEDRIVVVGSADPGAGGGAARAVENVLDARPALDSFAVEGLRGSRHGAAPVESMVRGVHHAPVTAASWLVHAGPTTPAPLTASGRVPEAAVLVLERLFSETRRRGWDKPAENWLPVPRSWAYSRTWPERLPNLAAVPFSPWQSRTGVELEYERAFALCGVSA